MESPFGHSLKISLALVRPWLKLGPGWAALAGALSTGQFAFDLTLTVQLVSLWLLVDPLFGMLWDVSVEQGLWRKVATAQLDSAATTGFSLPYVQPDSLAGRFVLLVRRYQHWWRESYWPENGQAVISFWLGALLALLIALFLLATMFWLTLLTIALTILAGQLPRDLNSSQGGRLQSVVQLLLPWCMGIVLWSPLWPLGLALAACYWVTYLGGLRMLGQHHRAEILFFAGQAVAIILLLSLRALPGAAIVSVLLIAQWLVKLKFNQSADFLQKVQPFLVMSAVVAGWAMGS